MSPTLSAATPGGVRIDRDDSIRGIFQATAQLLAWSITRRDDDVCVVASGSERVSRTHVCGVEQIAAGVGGIGVNNDGELWHDVRDVGRGHGVPM